MFSLLYLPLPNGWCVRAALNHTGKRDRLSDPALTGDGTEANRPTCFTPRREVSE